MMTTNAGAPHSAKLSFRFGLAGLIVIALLAGCADREAVIAGKREPIDAVLQSDITRQLVPETPSGEDLDVPIALPAQQSNAEWTHGIGTPAYRTLHPALSSNPQLTWSARIGSGDSRKQRITADPVVADGRVYTLDAASLVTATSTNGQSLWTRDLRPELERAGEASGGGISVEGGVVYAATGYGRLMAMDAATGNVIWTQDLDATGSGRPTVFGDLVYLVAGDATAWAINKESGRIAWQIGGSDSISNVLGAPAPVVVDDLAVFAFGSGELQAVFRRGGLRRWDQSVLGERQGRALSKLDDVTGAPVAADGVIYAGNQAGRTVAIEATSGTRIWTVGDGAIDPVLPVAGSVFMVSDRNELLRLDAADGTRIWTVRLPNFVKDRPRRRSEVFAHHGPILAGGRLIIASGDGVMRSYNPQNGDLLSTVEIPSGATTAPVVAGGTLYVVGRNGQLYAFR